MPKVTTRGDTAVAERPPAASDETSPGWVGAREDAGAAPIARREAFRAALASEACFATFYRDALPRVYGYLVNRCQGDAALAEDLAQAAFGEGIRQAASFDGRSDPVVWLIGIARHKLVDHFREQEREERRRMRLVVRELTLDGADDPWRGLDERALLIANLARLSASQRAVLILHDADGLPVREVARQIGRSEPATESLLSRARCALRALYEESGDEG